MTESTEILPDDQLARYIVESTRVRADNTVKADAFVPHPRQELSVTRHLGIEEADIWAIGDRIAAARSKPLYGRADFSALVPARIGLRVVADPVDGNPNHANITGWPASKPEQKSLAQVIAAEAVYKTRP